MLAIASSLTNVSLIVGRGRHSQRRPSRMSLSLSLVLNLQSVSYSGTMVKRLIGAVCKVYTLVQLLYQTDNQVGRKICSITNSKVGEGAMEQLAAS